MIDRLFIAPPLDEDIRVMEKPFHLSTGFSAVGNQLQLTFLKIISGGLKNPAFKKGLPKLGECQRFVVA